MTTLAVIGDVHAHWAHLQPVLDRIAEARVDGILLVGDLGSHDLGRAHRRTPTRDARYLASLETLFERVGALGRPFAWVPGNHDLPDLTYRGNVDRGGIVTMGDLRITGIGGAGPARFGFTYEWDEDEIRRRELPDADVLLVHCPPARTALDLVRVDEHVGSEAIRERALAHRGFLVCGHIHENPGAIQLGDCLCLNAGGLGQPFGTPQVGFLRREDGVDEVSHEDLQTGVVRRWTRA